MLPFQSSFFFWYFCYSNMTVTNKPPLNLPDSLRLLQDENLEHQQVNNIPDCFTEMSRAESGRSRNFPSFSEVNSPSKKNTFGTSFSKIPFASVRL